MPENLSSAELASRSQRLERRLEIIRKAVGHDLPNQLVVIQGLLQLLVLEESSRVSAEGQEYMRRLGGASARALEMVHLLKNIMRVGTQPEKGEAISLKELAGEVAAEIKQLSPGTVIEYHFSRDAQDVTAGRVNVHQALGGLLRLAATMPGAGLLGLGSRRAGEDVEIWVGPGPPPQKTLPVSSSTNKELENRLEWLLIRELGETWGGILRLVDVPDRGKFFVLTAPSANG